MITGKYAASQTHYEKLYAYQEKRHKPIKLHAHQASILDSLIYKCCEDTYPLRQFGHACSILMLSNHDDKIETKL